MSKRRHEEETLEKAPKRPRQDGEHQPPAVEEIHFARQLQEALVFKQDEIPQLRHGIASFKAFLESILYHRQPDDRARQLSILREFLDSQKPADPTDTERPFLGQLWQAWSFANQNNHDALSSSLGAIFALLLKTLSGLLDFREYGLLLGRTALQHQHLRLLKRGLEAPKSKDFLISPCLRFLTELAGFDGGVLARDLYKRREQAFDVPTLRRNLGLVKMDISEEEARRRPAIRTLTVRYILAHIKYLHEGGKIDLLKSRPLCNALFQHLRSDPADLVNELLSTLEQHVLKDDELPRSAKASLLLQQNLERVTEVATRSQEDFGAAEKAFHWLKAVCTTSSYGILRTSRWYPPGTTKADHGSRQQGTIDLGLDSIEFYDRDERIDVRNSTLLRWTLTLRPQSSFKERELIVLCFASAPELVGAYFGEKWLELESKLSNTWIGYASFLFEVICLPVPKYLGNEQGWAQLPPQTNIMIENILPQPLNERILTRCLNQSSELVTFFAVRLLILAFRKVAEVRLQLSTAAAERGQHGALWKEASERLITGFIQRCPSMKDVIATFRRTPDDSEHSLQREAITRLLRLYYDVTPLQAMEEQFDVSAPLTAALIRNQSEQNSADDETKELRSLELEHLLQIARHSPGMRWLSKQKSLDYSPILTLIKIHSKNFDNRQIREIIYHVLTEQYIMNSTTACDALICAMRQTHDDNVAVGEFVDDCLLRASRKPVKYLDDLEAVFRAVQPLETDSEITAHMPSNFVAVLLEQAPFVCAKSGQDKIDLEGWISSYLNLMMHSDDRCEVLESVQKSIAGLKGFRWRDAPDEPAALMERLGLTKPKNPEPQAEQAIPDSKETIPFSPPPVESQDHPELFKWSQKELESAIEDDDIEALMLCLCSQYPDIRAQAVTQLYKLEDKIIKSNLDDKDALYVLIGELVETYEHHCIPKSQALPYIAGTFATHALRVQMEPTHYMYPKLNHYLNKGPEWRIHKLPRYWIENTVLGQPEEDDAYWKEVQWVLDWIADGLRCPQDLEVLRRAGIFEKVMGLHASPGAATHNAVRERVMELLWRSTYIAGGSTTLVTRTGILSWLKMVKESGGRLASSVRKRVLDTCDRDKIERWCGFKVDEL